MADTVIVPIPHTSALPTDPASYGSVLMEEKLLQYFLALGYSKEEVTETVHEIGTMTRKSMETFFHLHQRQNTVS